MYFAEDATRLIQLEMRMFNGVCSVPNGLNALNSPAGGWGTDVPVCAVHSTLNSDLSDRTVTSLLSDALLSLVPVSTPKQGSVACWGTAHGKEPSRFVRDSGGRLRGGEVEGVTTYMEEACGTGLAQPDVS